MAPAQEPPGAPWQPFRAQGFAHACQEWQRWIVEAGSDGAIVDAAAGVTWHDPYWNACSLGSQTIIGIAHRMDKVRIKIAKDTGGIARDQDTIAVKGIALLRPIPRRNGCQCQRLQPAGLQFTAITGLPRIVMCRSDDDAGMSALAPDRRIGLDQALQCLRIDERVVVEPQVPIVIAAQGFGPRQPHAAVPVQGTVSFEQLNTIMPGEQHIGSTILAAIVGDKKIEHRVVQCGLGQHGIDTGERFLAPVKASQDHGNFTIGNAILRRIHERPRI